MGVAATLLLPLAGEALAEVVVLTDGTRLTVQSYELQGNRVVLTTLDGKLQSVSLRDVDLPATERLNGIDPPPRSETGATAETGTKPRVALSPVPTSSAPAEPAPSAQAPGRAASATTAVSALPEFSPPAPVAPEVITRDAVGNITVRATRLAEPLVVDGKLDDPIYSQVKPVNGFVQQEPLEGEPATEDSDAWIFFDDSNVYISVRCWDSQPERMIANEMRRDHGNIRQNENFSLVFDTFYDRRNGFNFTTNPLGAVRDQLVGDEGQNNNLDWNTVWDVKSAMDDQGWTFEMVVPFKSLRFKNAGPQVWSFNLRRNVKWKNETSTLAPIPAAQGGIALFLFSQAATLVGIEVPSSNRNLEVKPYALSQLTTDQTSDEPYSNDPDADFGFDVKYGLTSGLIGDFTYNTDFAQVEEDAQQINLTRFNLRFPEKREFFLEGQSIFAFGGAGGRGSGLTPEMFFSRRIGLTEEGEDPIRVGGRVTGRAGQFRIGALNIQTRGGEDAEGMNVIPATNFSVIRLRRDFLLRSDIGVIATYRNTSLTEEAESNGVFGFDGNFAFYENLRLNAYYARSRTALDQGGTTRNDNASYTGKLDYNGDRYGLVLEHLYVGEDFQPELGFMRREDFRRNYVQGRFSPRPRSIDWIRQFTWQADLDRITDTEGLLETRTIQGEFRINLENGDSTRVTYTNYFEFLPEEFEISDGVILPVGDYTFQDVDFSYSFGSQRKLPTSVSYRTGSFWSGNRDALDFNARIEISPKFSVEPRGSLNWVDLPEGSFDTRLASTRVTYTFSPRMALSSFIQYNSSSDSLSSSVRFRWEYEPGSDLFVVYSEGRDDLSLDPFLANRTLAVKFTKLFRF
jgi:hypothetical protein